MFLQKNTDGYFTSTNYNYYGKKTVGLLLLYFQSVLMMTTIDIKFLQERKSKIMYTYKLLSNIEIK